MGQQYSSLSNTQKPIDVPTYNGFVQEERYPSLFSFTRKPQDKDMASPEQKSNRAISGCLHFPAEKLR